MMTLAKILFLSSLIVISLAACHKSPSDEPPAQTVTKAAPIALLPSDVVTTQYGSLVAHIPFTGTIQSKSQTTIQAQNTATASHIWVDVGQQVSKGQKLVQFSNADYNTQLNSAKAQLNSAKAQAALSASIAKRKKHLYDQGFIAKLEYEQSLAESTVQQENLKTLQANIDLAQKTIQDQQIVSPISGYVIQRLVNVGQTVSPNQTLFEIVDPNQLEIVAQLSASDQPQLAIGQTVDFHIQGSNTQQRSQVSRINPFADPNSRSIQFFADVHAPARLSIGAFVEGTLVKESSAFGQIIPLSTIQSPDQSPFVWVIRQQQLKKVPIQYVQQDQQQGLAVVTGLLKNEQVSRIAFTEQQQGQPVQLKP